MCSIINVSLWNDPMFCEYHLKACNLKPMQMGAKQLNI